MVRKREVELFTRHLNMDCFESMVPANFVSYAPIFFAALHRQWWRLHMSEKFSSGMINPKQTNQNFKFYDPRGN